MYRSLLCYFLSPNPRLSPSELPICMCFEEVETLRLSLTCCTQEPPVCVCVYVSVLCVCVCVSICSCVCMCLLYVFVYVCMSVVCVCVDVCGLGRSAAVEQAHYRPEAEEG